MNNLQLVANYKIAKNELDRQWSSAFKGWPEGASSPNWSEDCPDQFEAAKNAYLAAFEVTNSIREEFQSLCIEIENRTADMPQYLTFDQQLKHLEKA